MVSVKVGWNRRRSGLRCARALGVVWARCMAERAARRVTPRYAMYAAYSSPNSRHLMRASALSLCSSFNSSSGMASSFILCIALWRSGEKPGCRQSRLLQHAGPPGSRQPRAARPSAVMKEQQPRPAASREISLLYVLVIEWTPPRCPLPIDNRLQPTRSREISCL